MSVFKQKATKGGEGFEKAPPGNHQAVLVAIVDLGTQVNEYGGERKEQRRAYFCWELVTEKQSGFKDRNHVIGIDVTVSLNEKAKLRGWIEARVGKQIPEGHEYDITNELGKPCLLTVTEKNGYPKVAGVGGVPKGLTVPAPQNKPFLFSLEDVADDGTVPDLPDWLPYHYGKPLKDIIAESIELSGPAEGGGDQGYPEVEPVAGGAGEEIPF